MNAPVPSTPAKIASATEAENLVRHLMAAMDALLATIEEETALVREGKLKAAANLEATKNDLARVYVADAAQVKANLPALAHHIPDLVAAMHKQHDSFNALLQVNLTVLATAHAVSEGLIRGAAAEVARKQAPQTYGNSGRPSAPPRDMVTPVSVSRTL